MYTHPGRHRLAPATAGGPHAAHRGSDAGSTGRIPGALDVTLEEAQIQRLERASPLDLGFPHDFLAREDIRRLTLAGTFDLIDNHRSG